MSRPMQTYKVTAPDGHILKVTGPAGASHEEVIEQAKLLYKPQAKPTEDLDAIRKAQAAKFPTRPVVGVDPGQSMTATEVAADQAVSNVEGAANLPRSIAETIKAVVGSYGNPQKQFELLKGLVGGTVGPAKTLARNVVALDDAYGTNFPGTKATAPTTDENRQMAEASGANAAATALSYGASKVSGVVRPGGPVDRIATSPAFLKIKTMAPNFSVKTPELNRWMQVEPKEMMHGSNPAEQIMKENLLGASKEATHANVKTALTEAGDAMQVKLQNAGNTGVRINAEPHVLGALQDAAKTIGKRSDSAFRARLDGILDDILDDYPSLDSMTPEQAHNLKVDLGKASKWSGAAEVEDLNKVLKDIYGRINGEIKAKIPDIVPDMERWGNLKTASGALKKGMTNDLAGRGTGAQPPTFQNKAISTAKKVAVPILAGAAGAKVLNDLSH